MKQSKHGQVIVTEGEGISGLGPNDKGPDCVNWREKAFELAKTCNEQEEDIVSLRLVVDYLSKELVRYRRTVTILACLLMLSGAIGIAGLIFGK